MSAKNITGCKESFIKAENAGHKPMVAEDFRLLAHESISVVTDRLTVIQNQKAASKPVEMLYLEAKLGIWIQQIYNQGRMDMANDIGNRLKSHIMTLVF